MIRSAIVLTLVALLALVLYLPARHSPHAFTRVLQSEHAAITAFWSTDHATRILARAVWMQDSGADAAPIPKTADALAPATPNTAAAREMDAATQRVFDSEYFRSIDALLLLASYRLSTLVEWLPWLLAFGMAAMFDGAMARMRKTKEVVQHDPELFAAWLLVAICTICGATIFAAVPMVLHPGLIVATPTLAAASISLAIGNYHRLL